MTVTASRSGANFFLEGLVELGVDYLFCNLGTDHAPIIEELARWKQERRRHPELILCPHENTAVHMAAGYASATGRGQAVLVHVDAGTANAAMGLHNLFRARLPVLLIAGKAPFCTHVDLPGGRDTYVHFVQEPYDQGSVVRPYVKWEYTLPSPALAKEVLARAHSFMHSDPMGPAYLMLPREILAAECDAALLPPVSAYRQKPHKLGGANPTAIRELAKRLITAEQPLLITAYAGRNPATPELIDRLARMAGIRVCEFNPIHLNISRDSPCFGGYQPAQFLASADVGLMVDIDVPWIPRHSTVNPDTFWAQLDLDISKRGMPMWSFPADLRIEGDTHQLLQQLIAELEGLTTPAFTERARQRVAKMAAEHQQASADAEARARDPGELGGLNPNYVCAALGKALQPEDIVLNEAITNAPVVFEQIPRTQGGSLVGLPGGGLGFSGGMALGLKLANPQRVVVQIVGDGTFYFSNPTSLLAVARQYQVPILTVVLDNSGWNAVRAATLRMYPDGDAWQTKEYASRLQPDMNFALVAQAAGAHGEILDDPTQVEPAIARCLQAVRNGQAAVLHVKVKKMETPAEKKA